MLIMGDSSRTRKRKATTLGPADVYPGDDEAELAARAAMTGDKAICSSCLETAKARI